LAAIDLQIATGDEAGGGRAQKDPSSRHFFGSAHAGDPGIHQPTVLLQARMAYLSKISIYDKLSVVTYSGQSRIAYVTGQTLAVDGGYTARGIFNHMGLAQAEK
jgi:hypothetical protein